MCKLMLFGIRGRRGILRSDRPVIYYRSWSLLFQGDLVNKRRRFRACLSATAHEFTSGQKGSRDQWKRPRCRQPCCCCCAEFALPFVVRFVFGNARETRATRPGRSKVQQPRPFSRNNFLQGIIFIHTIKTCSSLSTVGRAPSCGFACAIASEPPGASPSKEARRRRVLFTVRNRARARPRRPRLFAF